nr:chloride channel protein D-like isoform X2 [Geotrypetes seraphini]
MGLIGMMVGTTGFFTHEIIHYLFHLKWELADAYIQNNDFYMTWICILGIGLAMIVVSSGLVVFFCPSSSPSGLPEVIGFLNGTAVDHIFNVKTFFGTFISCVLAVASGLFCGPEGPMVHMGAIIGFGLSQFESETLGFQLPFFTRFRNSADRRNFITAGAGAGIASVFRAPVGGLLFVLEEVASFWDIRLAWQTFFCCLMAAFTTDLLSTSFNGFLNRGHFGFFKAENRILFWVKNLLDMSVIAFIPTIIIGILGGLLGALFISINIKINAFRIKIFDAIERDFIRNLSKLLEALLILTATATVSVYIPYFFPCTPAVSLEDINSDNLFHSIPSNTSSLRDISEYNCPAGITWQDNNGIRQTNRTFNQAAALLVENGKRGIMLLFQRGTHEEFGYASLFTALSFYFLFSCWTAGTAVASGLVIPMLYTGALYGRIIGLLLMTIFGVEVEESPSWIDPGLFAAIGAASFFSGVSRLTISLTVIMVEITNDVQSILVIMVAVTVAKMIGDLFNSSLYSALLKLKSFPYLDSMPCVFHGKKLINLELFSASDVMTPHVRVLYLHQNIASLADLLINTNHCAFPVVYKPDQEHVEIFLGTITRSELCMLLMNDQIFYTSSDGEPFNSRPYLKYEEITVEKLPDVAQVTRLLDQYSTDPEYQKFFINLKPYLNKSAVAVQSQFSLHRTYIIFRTLGLRHLTVVNSRNQVVGMITRKDITTWRLVDKLGFCDSDEDPLD